MLNQYVMMCTENDYVAKVKYALLVKKERARFPDDDEFATAFTERQIYLMNSKNKVYILERLENSGTAEDKDVYGHCDDGVYSIEHIMPQHLTPTWIKELGEDYEQIHEQWLHRIANLTLTAYNSKYSNNSFVEKKTMQNGFDDSGIRMNTYIAKKENWTLMANGFREELDAYYAGVHNSLIAKDKPTQVIPQYYREIFGYLEKNDIDGRTEFGEFILDFAYDERERLDESIRGRILREKQLGYMTPMWVEFDLFSYCCFVNIPDIESLSERHRKKYVYANMIDRKQNLCWYIFVDLDRNGHVNSIIARKVLSSQYVSDGFTTDEIHEYISEMKSRRKAHGTNMPSVHKRKVYPNELCPCGSGMKYKKCCGKNK